MDSIESRGGTEGGGGTSGATVNGGFAAAPPPPFLSKTYEMVDDPLTDWIVSWGPGNNSFVVWNTPEFAKELLPKYFKHNNFSSFVRQLNTYGFRKVDPDRWEFANEGFLRGQKHLLKTISRRKASHGQSQTQQSQAPNPNVSSCVEVGKFGLEEEIERLKRDKNVLMQELVKLRQQQQSTELQLKTLVQRLQGMEQRQQQMMSFLAKAMQSPGFLAQLVQQNDSNRRITGVNKKRRLPGQENEMNAESTAQDGQVIKYQPLITEAAKSMVMQILQVDTSPRRDSLGNANNFLFENFHSALEPYDSRNSVRRSSGVTLSEMPTTSGVQSLAPSLTEPLSNVALSCVPSSDSTTDIVTTAQIPNLSALSGDVATHPNTLSKLPVMQAVVPNGNAVVAPQDNHTGPDGGSIYINPAPNIMNDLVGIDLENLTSDIDVDMLGGDEKLPSINDPFWEQFFDEYPFSGDLEEVDSGTNETKDTPELSQDQTLFSADGAS